MSQLFSGKDKHLENDTFGADANYRVPTMQTYFGGFAEKLKRNSFF